ncbi:MAG: zf-HC2 domain-containing protein [Chloroflexi bacterium]|nr:zf-HC2 domain-containing protein [Chloroflexota bacterium]
MNEIGQSCHDLKAQLSDFIDGELDEAMCHEIQRHLEGCENCRVMVDTLKKTIMLYRNEPPGTVPTETHERLWKVLRLEELKESGREDRA